MLLTSDLNFLISGSFDMTVGIWCMKNFHLLAQLDGAIKIRDLMFSDDESYLVAYGEDNSMCFWKLE